jgi:hypothetical protein
MTHPQEARKSCDQCNGWYNSETELYEHMQMAHRRCVPQLSTSRQDVTRPSDFNNQVRASKRESLERERKD